MDSPYSSNKPRAFPSSYTNGKKMIAPFWADVMPDASNTRIWYHLYNKYTDATATNFLNTAKQLLVDKFPSSDQVNFEPNTALKVTWENIYPNPMNLMEVIMFWVLDIVGIFMSR